MAGKAGSSGPQGRGRPLKQRLESLALAGVTDLPKRSGRGRAAAGGSEGSPLPPAVAGGGAPRPSTAAGGGASAAASAGRAASAAGKNAATSAAGRNELLRVLGAEVAACRRCEPLAAARSHTVFGVGPPDARLCFLGEAPGADEDASGEPFVGRAGQLLTKIIEACTLSRNDVYILNVLKCRPPDNRPPLPQETANCRGYFERQLEIIAPEFICCLGTTAAQALLETDETIGKLRKRWFSWRSAQVICTYHPSYLLRNPPAKREVWDDMKLLMEKMGVRL